MHYLLNGGGHEMRSLGSDAVGGWLRSLGVNNVLIVAFAMAEPFWQRAWERPADFIQIHGLSVSSLTTTNYSPERAESQLAAADAVFMPGGVPAVLQDRLIETGFDKLLQRAVADGDLQCLAGASAGAMVLGTIYGSIQKPGLNLVPDHIIDVHFSSRGRISRLQEVIDAHPGLIGVGIDEDTNLILDNNFQPQLIIGDGTVTYYKNHTTMRTYDSNTTFPSQN